MKRHSSFWVVVGSIFLFAPCNKGEVFFRFHQIENSVWDKNSPIVFDTGSMDVSPSKYCDVSVEITSNGAYPYQNIWLFIEQNLQDSLMHTDSLEIQLADSNRKWLGSKVGELCQLSIPYIRSVQLDSAKSYRLQIRQGMSDEKLKGIEKNGIKIMKSGFPNKAQS